MKYKNLVFIVFVAINCISQCAEQKNQPSYRSPINFTLGAIAAASTLKCLYHVARIANVCNANEKIADRYHENVMQHNQKVVNAGHISQITNHILDNTKFPQVLAEMSAEYAHPGKKWATIKEEFVKDANSVLLKSPKSLNIPPHLVMGVHVDRYRNSLPEPKINSFMLLTESQKAELTRDKKAVLHKQEKLLKSINDNCKLSCNQFVQAGGTLLFAVVPAWSALATVNVAYAIKSRLL